jgi:ABC-type branched-subunit amino acid transport system substrate-binding protein
MSQQGAIRPFAMAFLAVAAVLIATTAQAQRKYDPGVTDTEIKIGNIMPYSGPASAYSAIGTPSNTAIQKYMNLKKVPQLFVASGATKWGDPKNFPWTMGWQPNYQSEGRIYAKYIMKNYPNGKIAVFWQNDDAGRDQFKGLKDGLGERVNMIVADASYEVSDPTIDSQIVTLKNSGADIFISDAAPKGAAQAIKKVADQGVAGLYG